MHFLKSLWVSLLVSVFSVTNAWPSDDYQATIDMFKNADESGGYFNSSYGYAVFPTIGKAGIGVGGAYGKGRVYVGGKPVGDTSMTQLSVGFQMGGQAFSQIIFFQDERVFKEFSSGNFEFGANAQATSIAASASASAATTGGTAGASLGRKNATAGGYHNGMAVFTVAKGGLMYEVSVSGQKFTYTPR